MQTTLAAIFIFMLVILVHEFGHFAVAKLVGIKVNEFSIGMGPKILQKDKGETKYTLRLLPIGGYVSMEGEDEDSNDERSFQSAPVVSRIGVIAAGAIMNFILAIVVFSIVTFMIGNPTNTVDAVIENTPAEIAGIQVNDKIVKVNEKNINSWEDVIENISTLDEGEVLNVEVLRDGKIEKMKLETIKYEESVIIGVQPRVEKSLITSIKGGFTKTYFTLISIVDVFKMLFTGEIGSEALSGPVGVISGIGEATKMGFVYVLIIMGMISVNLGFFNLIPIPALDGSRLMFLLIELVRGKPIDPEKEGRVHFIGFLFLISLMLLVTYKDIVTLIFGR